MGLSELIELSSAPVRRLATGGYAVGEGFPVLIWEPLVWRTEMEG